MAKRIYSATVGAGLTAQATKAYDQYIEVDFDGWSETKHMSLDTLLRSEVFPAPAIDGSGSATYTLSYATYDRISFTIDQDCVVTLSDLPAGSTNYLKVTKGAADIISFLGVTGTIYSMQSGQTSLLFRIEKRSVTYIEQINNQFSDSLVIGDLTPVSGSITTSTFSYFKSVVNNNVCHFEADFGVSVNAGSTDVIAITISNWDVVKEQVGYTSCNIIGDISGAFVSCNAKIKEDGLVILLGTASSTQTNFIISGTFKVI